MAVLDSIFKGADHFQSALGRTSARQAMLTNNLANVNVPGYKRKDQDFHVILAGENTKLSQNMQNVRDQVAQRASDQSSIRNDGNNVDLEREVMSIAETEMHFQAVADLTAGYFAGMKNVIREGK